MFAPMGPFKNYVTFQGGHSKCDTMWQGQGWVDHCVTSHTSFI